MPSSDTNKQNFFILSPLNDSGACRLIQVYILVSGVGRGVYSSGLERNGNLKIRMSTNLTHINTIDFLNIARLE